jgi:hypothetical protein
MNVAAIISAMMIAKPPTTFIHILTLITIPTS